MGVAGSHHFASLGGLLVLALVALALAPLPLAAELEARAGAAVAPLADGLSYALRPVADVALNAGQLRTLSDENATLHRELARLEAENTALREVAIAVEQVAALRRSVAPEQAQRFQHASVLLRDPSPARSSVLIDRGRRHGVKVGQPVLGPGATLVGTVVDVEAGRARVRLLDDPASAVTAVVQESRVPAALVGTHGGLRLEFVPAAAALAEGDVVLSSALGGRLPGGLLLGRITAVRADDRELFATVEVEPLVDYRRLEHVLVMTNFAPAVDPAAGVAATFEAP